MEALGAGLTHPVERRRQHVLAGVLLHVVEAPCPVHRALDAGPDLEAAVEHVHEPAILVVDDVDDAAAAERAEVVGLSAGGRIERGGRERHLEAIAGGVRSR